MDSQLNCVATCRPGLESILASEIRQLDGSDIKAVKRAVEFTTDQAGLYRMNMGLRTAIQVLVPLRTFNARDYKWLYFQARRTNWHHYFTNDKTIRIDVNGNSPVMRNTQYVVHRVKDGIVDTFRKLNEGVRPSIDKEDPDIHVLVHLKGDRVTLYLDSAGSPLFKRGYRDSHTGAPIKEDLAAGILQLSRVEEAAGVIDPMCGSGTFLFEAWMLKNQIAPNLERSFAFENWQDYRQDLHTREKDRLRANARLDNACRFIGSDVDPAACELAESIAKKHFPDAAIEWINGPVQEMDYCIPDGLLVTNPPYGERLGADQDLEALYKDLGYAAKRMVPGGRMSLFTTNRKAARQIRLKSEGAQTLFNGSLEGLLYQYALKP